jgi:hypothetical protein
MRWSPLLLAAGFLLGCRQGWDAQEERFVNAYAEILVARQLYPDTAVGNARVREILTRYGYSGEREFREHFLALARDPVRLRRVFDSIATRAQALLPDSLRHRKPSPTAD